jgi:hypothetical protein
VIIVPRSTEAKPLPSRVLLERVADYLDARRLTVVDLKIVPPNYFRVDVTAEIVLTSIDRASEVQAHVIEVLRRFLHPLTGGRDDTGWDFGRMPHDSDVLQRIGDIPGVDHVRSLTVKSPERRAAASSGRAPPLPDQPDDEKTLALVSAGSLEITVTAGNA